MPLHPATEKRKPTARCRRESIVGRYKYAFTGGLTKLLRAFDYQLYLENTPLLLVNSAFAWSGEKEQMPIVPFLLTDILKMVSIGGGASSQRNLATT